jgi:hypothetical protein
VRICSKSGELGEGDESVKDMDKELEEGYLKHLSDNLGVSRDDPSVIIDMCETTAAEHNGEAAVEGHANTDSDKSVAGPLDESLRTHTPGEEVLAKPHIYVCRPSPPSWNNLDITTPASQTSFEVCIRAIEAPGTESTRGLSRRGERVLLEGKKEKKEDAPTRFRVRVRRQPFYEKIYGDDTANGVHYYT